MADATFRSVPDDAVTAGSQPNARPWTEHFPGGRILPAKADQNPRDAATDRRCEYLAYEDWPGVGPMLDGEDRAARQHRDVEANLVGNPEQPEILFPGHAPVTDVDEGTNRSMPTAMAPDEIVATAAIDAADKPQRALRKIDGDPCLAFRRPQIALEYGRGRHVAQCNARSAFARAIGRRSVDHVDVVQ